MEDEADVLVTVLEPAVGVEVLVASFGART
jgi:hypothetical protein